MLILHDSPSGDLSHIQAIGEISEGFALFDYVRIVQPNGAAWIGQVVEPNQNISLVGNRLDPTILHGLQLMQTHPDVQAVRSAQVFDILILGEDRDGQMLTPRLRPLPGAKVARLNAVETARIIEIPPLMEHTDGGTNVIGQLLNADDVPLCVDRRKFNYHIMVAGGTGSGKSNVCANLVDQAVKYGFCVLIHDAKPDYRKIKQANTDARVDKVWECFEDFGLRPHEAVRVKRIGFHGVCDPTAVDEVVGFRASDFFPEMLAGLFFTGTETPEVNGYEGFLQAANYLDQRMPRTPYTLDDILADIRRRMQPETGTCQLPAEETIHRATVMSILQKVTRRRALYPWLDAVGKKVEKPAGKSDRQGLPSKFQSGDLDGVAEVTAFNLEKLVEKGRVLVIDYNRVEDHSYAVIMSYFLSECQRYRKPRHGPDAARAPERPGLVQLVDEAHRLFDNRSRHGPSLAGSFGRVMREGRSVDHCIILSLQNASQIPNRVMNNLNTRIVMRQNSKAEAEAATETMGKEFAAQAMRLGTGHALALLHESRATVLAQMAPSPYELERTDNARAAAKQPEEASRPAVRQAVAPGVGNGPKTNGAKKAAPPRSTEINEDEIPF